MATYWDVLAAVKGVIEALPGFDGVPVMISKWPGFQALQGSVREVIVSPRDDLAELIPELHFQDDAWIDYEVFVVLVTESRFDEETLRWRLDRRLDLRSALYRTDAVAQSVGSQFDVSYDPSPGGVDAKSIPETLDWTAQKFTFRTSESRV